MNCLNSNLYRWMVIMLLGVLPVASTAEHWWASEVEWNVADSDAFSLDTLDSVPVTADFSSFVLDTTANEGLSGAGSSGSFALDTRILPAISLTVSGPSAVAADSVEWYTATATDANGVVSDVSDNCEWRLVGVSSGDGEMRGNRLVAGNPESQVTGQIRASYPHVGGAIEAAPYPVTIAKGFIVRLSAVTVDFAPGGWEISVQATPSGGTGAISYQWYIDDLLLSGANSAQLDDYPLSNLLGTRRLTVWATDSETQTASAASQIVLNKPPIPEEPPLQYPVRDPAGGDMLNSSGGEFAFQPERIPNGIVIVTHGLWSSGAVEWCQSLADNIGTRLEYEEKGLPNICIFDWEDLADPTEYEAANTFQNWILLNWLEDIGDAVLELFSDTISIHHNAVAEGKSLANWIHEQIQAGNISATAPIHLIGHSAGGYVMGECACRLKDKGIHFGLVQVTTLDTPYPIILGRDNTRVYGLSLGSPYDCRAERYFYGQSSTLNSLPFVGSGPGVYERGLMSWQWTSIHAHSWVHEWYDENTTDYFTYDEQDGFYYSPFMDNGFPNISGSGGGGANALRMYIEGGFMPMGTTNEPLSGFETFGLVTENAELYTITEESNAGMFKDVAWPVGAQEVTFQYRFTSPGDGDYLVIYGDTNGAPLFIGADLELTRSDFIEGSAPVVVYGGTTNRMTFMLVSRGETNAVLEIQDIQLVISDDPDFDGVVTADEIALGTNPLQADTDGDGLSDYDEINTYFTDPLLADSDGDGVNDLLEILAGTNPNDSSSTLELAPHKKLPNGDVEISWQGVAGKTYKVNRSSDLLGNGYVTIGRGVSGVAPMTTFQDTNTVPRNFYWVVVEP